MLIHILKSKIHFARITESVLEYDGSITIDRDIMDKAGIYPYERVLVSNMENGNRFETYVIEGKRASGIICLNGAAARLGTIGDRLTIMAFSNVDENEARKIKPKIVILKEKNEIKSIIGG
ncbi:aspartate 1-decarboxylase [candidate division KSB1 bacterium]|nr:MAG: aspartate 1-decarboxylase [candidate division KSB1 bacterium]